jgi:hypothetical protein
MRRRSMVPWILPLLVLTMSCSNRRADPEDPPADRFNKELRPNIRASEIRVVADRGDIEPAPEIQPAKPTHLVIDDCRGLVFFAVPDSGVDQQRGVIVLNWNEGTTNRSLTILFKSPTCESNEVVKRWLDHFAA